MYRFHLIVTSRKPDKEILRFIESIVNQNLNDNVVITHINQNFNFNNIIINNSYVKLINIDSKETSLVNARNIGIDHYQDADIIAFPDDDCWYDLQLLQKVSDFFEKNRNVACLCTNVFDPILNVNYGNRPKNIILKVNKNNIFKLPISVGLFFNAKIFYENNYKFNDRLGAGNYLGSGEETELVSRVLENGYNIIYNGFFSVYHELNKNEDDIVKALNYGRGYGYVAALLISRRNYYIFYNLLITVVKSLLAIFIFYKKKKYYLNRLIGIYEGIKSFIKEDIDDQGSC